MKYLVYCFFVGWCLVNNESLLAQCKGELTVKVAGSITGGNVETTILSQPNTVTTFIDSSFTLSVVASGYNLTYQWIKDNQLISGANKAIYAINAATSADTGSYFVVVRGDCGTDKVSKTVTVSVLGVKLIVKVFLEGCYSNGLLSDDLRTRNILPASEPYSNLGFTPVANTSSENMTPNVGNVSGSNAIVDWIWVELRDKLNPKRTLYTRSGLLLRDGSVVDTDGKSALNFKMAKADDYYLAIRHRNHLGFRAARMFSLSSSTNVFNFTNGSIATFGSNALKLISKNIYAMYAGDANRDGVINALDYSIWQLENGTSGYKDSDFNLNGFVNAVDINDYWLINKGIVQQLD